MPCTSQPLTPASYAGVIPAPAAAAPETLLHIHERFSDLNSPGSPAGETMNILGSPHASVFKASVSSPLVRIKRREKAAEPKSIMDFIRR